MELQRNGFGRRIRLVAIGLVAGMAAWAPAGSPPAVASPVPKGVSTPVLTGPPITTGCDYSNSFGAPRGGGRSHEGVDVFAGEGDPVLAVTDGTITRKLTDHPGSLGGNVLRLTWAGGSSYYVYSHLESFADGIDVGSHVRTGDVIGYLGATGNASVAHLHFEVHPFGNRAVDPTPYLDAVGACGHSGPAPRAASGSSGNRAAQAPPMVTSPKASTATSIPPSNGSGHTDSGSAGAGTTAAPAARSGLNAEVMVTGRVQANDVFAVPIVGFPGLPASSISADVTVKVTADAAGRAAAWPCGQRSGLESGMPITVTAGTSSTSLTIAPGARGSICIVGDTAASYRVVVTAVH